MTTLHFQTHVSDSGVITLPLPDAFRGENVTVKVDVPSDRIPKRSFEELCGVWSNEEDREDVDRMVAAIHEGRLLETKRESLETQNIKVQFTEPVS